MTVREMLPEDTQPVLDLTARAFFDDPLFTFVYPDPATRYANTVREYRAYLRHVYRPVGRCDVAEVDGRVMGVALWLPPGVTSLWWREWSGLPALVRGVGLRRLVPVLRAYRAFDAAWPEGDIHYLGLLAVAPDAQGRGVGSALVRAGLARADRDGVPTYLETGTLDNVRFYERLGFRVTDEIPLPNGPTHWGMLRDGPRLGPEVDPADGQ